MIYTTTITAASPILFTPDEQKIISAVSEASGVPVSQIVSYTRQQKVVYCRFIIYKILVEKGYAYAHIARIFNRDHTGVMHGLKTFAAEVDKAPFLAEIYMTAKQSLNPIKTPQ